MAIIEARVQIHLPHDANGVSASPGQVITVDTDHPQILGYLQVGYIVALSPLEFPGDLKPPAQVSDEDAEAIANADPPEIDVEAEPLPGEPGSTQGRDGFPLKDAGEPIAPADLEEQAAEEREEAASAASSDDATDPTGDAAEAQETGKTRSSRAKK